LQAAAEPFRHKRSARGLERLDLLSRHRPALAPGPNDHDRVLARFGNDSLDHLAILGDDHGRFPPRLHGTVWIDDGHDDLLDRPVGRLGEIRADDLADRLGPGRGRAVAVAAVAGEDLAATRLVTPAADCGGERGKLFRREAA